MKLSIIILSYNTKDLLVKCLGSIAKHLPKSLYEVIVVDNNSVDGTVEAIQSSKFKVQSERLKLKIIKNKENTGFARGCNQGTKEAKGEFLLFLNSDAELHDASIKEMVDFMAKHESIGILGGILQNADRSLQRSFGRFYTLPHAINMLLFGDKSELRKEDLGVLSLQREIKHVDWVSGGFMMVRKNIFEKLKGFDEGFFMYMEDMELCFRAKRQGYIVSIYPQATVTHASHGSSNRSFAIQQIYKGLLYYYKKHKSLIEYIILKIVLTLKAYMLIMLGLVTNNNYLKNTYRGALRAF